MHVLAQELSVETIHLGSELSRKRTPRSNSVPVCQKWMRWLQNGNSSSMMPSAILSRETFLKLHRGRGYRSAKQEVVGGLFNFPRNGPILDRKPAAVYRVFSVFAPDALPAASVQNGQKSSRPICVIKIQEVEGLLFDKLPVSTL